VDYNSGVAKFEFFHALIPPLFMFMWGDEFHCGHLVKHLLTSHSPTTAYSVESSRWP